MGLKPPTFVSIFAAHRDIHLRHSGLILWQNWLGFISMQLNYWPCVWDKYMQLATRLLVRIQLHPIFFECLIWG